MRVPTDRKYLETHEWHRVDGHTVTIGITQFAADQLSDVTYVDLPKVCAALTAGKPFGEIESVKATSELFSGVAGKVLAINTALEDHPELVNSDPFNAGWMIKVQAANLADVEKLLPASEYERRFSE